MTHIKQIIALLLLSFFIISCDKDEENPTPSTPELSQKEKVSHLF
jgi:PBP1b-binding outer membrane lipoprotein LpoB